MRNPRGQRGPRALAHLLLPHHAHVLPAHAIFKGRECERAIHQHVDGCEVEKFATNREGLRVDRDCHAVDQRVKPACHASCRERQTAGPAGQRARERLRLPHPSIRRVEDSTCEQLPSVDVVSRTKKDAVGRRARGDRGVLVPRHGHERVVGHFEEQNHERLVVANIDELTARVCKRPDGAIGTAKQKDGRARRSGGLPRGADHRLKAVVRDDRRLKRAVDIERDVDALGVSARGERAAREAGEENACLTKTMAGESGLGVMPHTSSVLEGVGGARGI